MIVGIIILAVVSFIGIISYRRPRLEQRVIKNIPLIDWINILIFPIIIYFGIIILVKNILLRTRVAILDFDEFILIGVGLLFLIYAAVGNSIHFVSKVLSRYLKPNPHSRAYQINEIFHGKLSHYLAFVSSMLVVFVIAILEINYPSALRLTTGQTYLTIIASIVFGISMANMIFITHEWLGGYNKPLASLALFIIIILLAIFRTFSLSLLYYPVNLFVITLMTSFISAYLIRQFLIFTKLGAKRRLRFLAKMLSI